jgi:5-methylcytosine-specific restriction endonuclease McrA
MRSSERRKIKEAKRAAKTYVAPLPPLPPGPVNYRDYINSPRWEAFRRRWYQSSGLPKACLGCRESFGTMELHHVTYERLGTEWLNDVVPLCPRCHEAFHERFSSNQCRGLALFEDQMQLAFHISREDARNRLLPFVRFVHKRWTKNHNETKEHRVERKAKARASAKLTTALRFQAKMCPPRPNPFG